MIAVIYVARVLYEDGNITMGAVAGFAYYMLGLVFNFMIMSMVFGNIASVMGAADKICELMQFEPTIKSRGGDTIKGETNGGLEVRDVKFHYPAKKTHPFSRA